MKRNKFLAFFVIVAMMLVGLTACNIDLNAAKINIKTPATKTMYEIGEEFTASGLIIEAEDDSGLKIALTDDLYEIDSSAFDKTKAGEYPIVIKLKADPTKTAEYKVTVLAPNVPTAIEIDNTGTNKLTYELGDIFTGEGLLLVKTMSRDGAKILCGADEYTIDSSAFDNTKAGGYPIVIKLKADPTKTVEYKVTVLEVNVSTGINIKADGAQKLKYEISETFTAVGLIIEKTMSRDGAKILCGADEYTIDSSAFDNTKAGEYPIVIKLKADPTKTAEYNVTVLAPNVVTSIAIKSGSAYKSVFEIAEAFNHEGLIIEKVMSRGNRILCQADEFNVNSEDFNNMVSGNYTIIVTLTADVTKSVSYDVTVSAAKVSSISIQSPAKLVYELNEPFSSSGLIINKSLTDGNVTTCSADEYTIDSTAFDNTKAGVYKIIIKLKADPTKIAEYNVTVLAANVPTAIEIKDTGTNKLTYELGDIFTGEGLIIEKTMSRDGAKILCSADEYTIDSTAFDNTKAGVYKIIIKLKADPTKIAEYTVMVKELAVYVGKYILTGYKSDTKSLSIDILPDGKAIIYPTSSKTNYPLVYTYKATLCNDSSYFLEFKLDSGYGYLDDGLYFNGNYSNGVFTVGDRFPMCGEHKKMTSDLKSVEIVFWGNTAAFYYFADEFILVPSTLFGFAELVDAGSIGIFTDADCTVLADLTTPITSDTTLYIDKAASSIDKGYYGTYVMPITVNEATSEVIEGIPMVVGDVITAVGLVSEREIYTPYVVTKADDTYVLTFVNIPGHSGSITIKYDSASNSYVALVDVGALPKVDISKYAMVTLCEFMNYDSMPLLIILKGNAISENAMQQFGLSFSYVKDDESTLYKGEPVTEDLMLYAYENGLLIGRQFSAGDFGKISFVSGAQYYLRGNDSFIYGKYKSVLSDNKYSITLSLDDSDTTYAIGIYDIALGTLVITLDGKEITFILPKYSGHALFYGADQRPGFTLPIPIEINCDIIEFDIFGYVHTATGDGHVVGTYEISEDMVNARYAMTVVFGANWSPASTTLTGYYDALSGNVVLKDDTYYLDGSFRYHPITLEGLTSADCYDKNKNRFSLGWGGSIRVEVNPNKVEANSDYYQALLTSITTVGKGVYEIDFIVVTSQYNDKGIAIGMTKIIANVLDKTYTVTIGGIDYIFELPPYGFIRDDRSYVYENSSFRLDMFGNYVYTVNGVENIGTFTAVVDNNNEKYFFKFFNNNGAFLYNAYADWNLETLFVTMNGNEIAFSSRQEETFPELVGRYESEAGATDTVVLEIVDLYNFTLTVNEKVINGRYTAQHTDAYYNIEFTKDVGRIYAKYSSGIMNFTVVDISYTLTKVGGEVNPPVQDDMIFRDNSGNEVFLMSSNKSCSLILGGIKYYGSFSSLGKKENIELYELQTDKGNIQASLDLKSNTLSLTYLDIPYVLERYGGQINPPVQYDKMFKDANGNQMQINSSGKDLYTFDRARYL